MSQFSDIYIYYECMNVSNVTALCTASLKNLKCIFVTLLYCLPDFMFVSSLAVFYQVLVFSGGFSHTVF